MTEQPLEAIHLLLLGIRINFAWILTMLQRQVTRWNLLFQQKYMAKSHGSKGEALQELTVTQ